MRRVLIVLALSPLLMAQGLPRPLCGFGEGLSHLREVERDAAQPLTGVTEARVRGERLLASLTSAFATFRDCGCPRLTELAAEAATVAQSAPSEASVSRLAQVFAQIRFRTQLAREQSERHACR